MKQALVLIWMLTLTSLTYAQQRDADGDGVADYEDACPSVAGPKNNKGCPVKDSVKTKVSIKQPVSGVAKILFAETFDDNRHQWPIRPWVPNSKVSSGEITGGAYQATTGANQQFTVLQGIPIDRSKKFTVSMDMQPIMNLFDEGAGILFGGDGKSNMYLLLITNRGSYSLMKLSNGEQKFLIPWTKTALLKTNETNKLSLMQEAGKWRIFINGQPAQNITADTFFADAVGIFQAGNQVNRFDNFIVQQWD